MRFISDRNVLLIFIAKTFEYIVVLNLMISAVLWILKILHLFTLVLTYEAIFISSIGVLQILASYIYKENRYPLSGVQTKWFDFKRFAELKPAERQRYRQEGKIMIIIGIILLVATIILHFSIPY